MTYDDGFLYERFLARDAAFDGRAVAGVRSTGIYCRFTCPARRPRRENVAFYENGVVAAVHGLRACLRCHPDRVLPDAEAALLDGLARRLAAQLAEIHDVRSLAALAGLGPSTLTRLFRRRLDTTPATFLARMRVDAAASALSQTDRAILDIAYGVGFASASAFHARFRAATGFSPASYRQTMRGLS